MSPPPATTGLDAKVAVIGYLCLCLSVLFLGFLLVAAPQTLHALTREDHWVENLTAVWFLLAGFPLFGAAWMERSFSRRCVYILGGMVMVFAFGEEISWGQRIFGFATPDFLMSLNQKKEFNVHAINNVIFSIIYLNSALVLCVAASAAFFCRKDRLFGISLPSIPLMLGFLIMLSYESGTWLGDAAGMDFVEYLARTRISYGFIVIEVKALLLLFCIFALISRQAKLFVAFAATLALVFALSYVNYDNVYRLAIVDRGVLFEAREYLLGIACLFYSLEIMLRQGRLGAILPASFSGVKLPGGRVPLWLMTCSLVVAGSIALILFQYFSA